MCGVRCNVRHAASLTLSGFQQLHDMSLSCRIKQVISADVDVKLHGVLSLFMPTMRPHAGLLPGQRDHPAGHGRAPHRPGDDGRHARLEQVRAAGSCHNARHDLHTCLPHNCEELKTWWCAVACTKPHVEHKECHASCIRVPHRPHTHLLRRYVGAYFGGWTWTLLLTLPHSLAVNLAYPAIAVNDNVYGCAPPPRLHAPAWMLT